MRERGFGSFEELCRQLNGAGGLALQDAMIEAITTSETSFFRDAHVFETFRRHILPSFGRRARFGAAPRPPGKNLIASPWSSTIT